MKPSNKAECVQTGSSVYISSRIALMGSVAGALLFASGAVFAQGTDGAGGAGGSGNAFAGGQASATGVGETGSGTGAIGGGGGGGGSGATGGAGGLGNEFGVAPGGAGGSTPGADGGNGSLGGDGGPGGGGGAHGYVGKIDNFNTPVTGGAGGRGGPSDFLDGGGGGGGGGGFGAVITGLSGVTGTVGIAATGGTGGIGGEAIGSPVGGNGGNGGSGLVLFAPTGTNHIVIDGSLTGGAGGAGGRVSSPSGNAGSAGNGGSALVLQSPVGATTVLINSSVTGGDGGAGGTGGIGTAGAGGSGGAGVRIGSGGDSVLDVASTISGGNGGVPSNAGASSGAGGAGIEGTDVTIRLLAGSIVSGGLSGDGLTRANAIVLTGGTNRLELHTGPALSGNVVANGFSTLAFTDGVSGVFDVSQIGGSAQFQGFSEIAKEGGMTLSLTGITIDTAAWTIDGGTLLVNGSIASSVLTTVNSGGTLGGAGTVGNTTVASGGILAPGNSIGTLTVAGDLLFASGSRFLIEADPDGTDSDRVVVTGTADIQGGTVVHVGPDGGFETQRRYTILTAGTRQGEFEDVESDFAYLIPELDYVGNQIDLTLVRRAAPVDPVNPIRFSDLAETANQTATADAAESLGSGNALFDAIEQLPIGAPPPAFDVLSGEAHASAKTALVEASTHLRNAANDRIRSAFGTVAAAPLPVMAYGDDGLDKMAGTSPAIEHAPTAWGHVFGSWGSTDGNGNAAELDRSTLGAVAGIDGMMGTWRIGVLAGYSRSSFDLDDRSSSGDADNYHLGIYGGTQWGAVGFRTGIAYTWSDIETQRTVAFPGFTDSLTADYDAGTFQAFGELGYTIETGAASFEPFINLAHVNVRTDGFTETGGAAALTTARSGTDTTFTTLGVRASADFAMGDATATARGMIGWRHAFGDITPLATHAFAGGNAFTVAGTPIAKDAAVLEAGLDFNITPTATLGLSYEGQIGSGSSVHGGRIGLNVRF